jgi:hypothetical protein
MEIVVSNLAKQDIGGNDNRYNKVKEEQKKIVSKTVVQVNNQKEGFRKNKELFDDRITETAPVRIQTF